MQIIKDLDPPYVGGPDWVNRRNAICSQAENLKICEHPFMAENLDSQQPIPVKEWVLQQ